jgi:amino acid transporter
VPQLRDYFAHLIAVVGGQKSNFDSLDSTTVNWIPWVVLGIGIVVILFSLLMIFLSLRGVTRKLQIASASVVVLVGVAVVALVLALNLIPRLNNGQKLLNALTPAFTVPRVRGDHAGIRMVQTVVNAEDPIMTPAGGAAAEVPKLVAFVAAHAHLSRRAVLSTLTTHFPNTTAVLLAIPLTSVSAELPAVKRALAPALPKIPHLAQTVLNAPSVTSGWNNVPGTAGAKNFEGGPVQTVPEITAYFAHDVIPVLEQQRRHWMTLTTTSKINFIGWLVLSIGVIAIVYGLLMVLIARTRPRAPAGA